MANKISYESLLIKVQDPDIEESELRQYFTLKPGGDGAFAPIAVPDPEAVEMTQDNIEAESALHIGNDLCRWRRQVRVKRLLRKNDPRPLLVSEGDSWFQFPLFLDDVVDNLSDDYLVWSLDAAGDTAQNMVFGQLGRRKTEYLRELQRNRDRVKAFLFSGAGNDVIGEDSMGKPVLLGLLKSGVTSTQPADYVDEQAFTNVLKFLRSAYERVVTSIRNQGLNTIPIICHGYDYAIPGTSNDGRSPIWAKPDEWLGGPLTERGIHDAGLRDGIIRHLIDGLYNMLHGVARAHAGVHIVDLRGTLPKRSDWADEIHPTDDGFNRVAAKFKACLQAAGV